nr:hypothetical protein [Tanacetum cinerariifolium]
MENPEKAFVDYASWHTDEARGDPQSSSRPLNSINAIKTCFKPTNDFQKDQLQVKTLMVNKIRTPKPKEPEKALEDEFKDLHLKLSILEVLAHAPIYNSILDKYVKSLELGIVKNVEVHIRKLKLLEDFYVLDMEKDPTCPLLVGRGFLATASAVIDCKKAKIAVGEGTTRKYLRVEGIDEKKIDWNKPPKEGEGAWHIKIELIDPDGEKFNRTFQSIPTTRKLSEKENLSEIIDLEHFYDAYECESKSI